NRRLTKKTIKGKEGLHPGSRKAGQLTRVHLRTAKLQSQAKARKEANASKVQRPLFFYNSLSSPHPLTVPSLKALVALVYLTRYDTRIEELVAERRPGRPKAKELSELEEVKARETKEYETGLEVPDLTHPPTTRLLHGMLSAGSELTPAHIDLLRFVRVFKDSDQVEVTRPGRTGKMGLGGDKLLPGDERLGEDWT
ncbi:hypothetical protein BCR39DRAFT_450231, partial [Naematelia encephala]